MNLSTETRIELLNLFEKMLDENTKKTRCDYLDEDGRCDFTGICEHKVTSCKKEKEI